MCGIVGVVCDPAAGPLYEALLALQHRGQDAAGMVTADGDHLCLHKDNGMVTDVFSKGHIGNLHGDVGIGHVRYPTAGSSSCAEAQPFYVNSPYGIALAHNGNLVNTKQLQEDMMQASDCQHHIPVGPICLTPSLARAGAAPHQHGVR